jgi:hypothetical protein
MSKKLSQADIDKQLGEEHPKLELDHAPLKKDLEEKQARAEADRARSDLSELSELDDERAHPDDRPSAKSKKRGSGKIGKISFDFQLLLKAFLVILVLKSWWILVMWGISFFFKSWPFLGIFRIQPYLVPNLLVGWYLVWKGKLLLDKKVGELKSLGENTDRHEIAEKVLGFLFCQCPASLFFAITGLNSLFATYLGVIATILCNVMGGVVLRYYVPRRYPKLNLE